MTIVRFKRVPDWFVKHYQEQLGDWAKNIRSINQSNQADGLPPNTKRIILREGTFADVSPDPTMGPVTIQVTLHMKVSKSEGKMIGDVYRETAAEVIITPYSEHDEALIRQHVSKMERLRIDPVKRLIEPARAGIPFMPNRLWVPPGAMPEDGRVH